MLNKLNVLCIKKNNIIDIATVVSNNLIDININLDFKVFYNIKLTLFK